jgi:hypothetical protein
MSQFNQNYVSADFYDVVPWNKDVVTIGKGFDKTLFFGDDKPLIFPQEVNIRSQTWPNSFPSVMLITRFEDMS